MDLNFLINGLAALLIVMTFLPKLNVDHWVVRVLDFPRLQIATLLILIVILQLSFFDATIISVVITIGTIVAVTYQLRWIIPYTPLSRQEVKKAHTNEENFTITILSANVLMTNRNSDQVLKLVDDFNPDIIVTLETNRWWQQQLQPLEKKYPYLIQCPLDNLYGMHVYSKMPLKNSEIKFLVEEDKPSMHTAIELPDGKMARLHFLHPAPPSPTENDESSERDAELLVLAKELKAVKEPVIVAGDLNDVAWSRTTSAFRKISGLLDPRIGRGTFNTFHAKYWFLRWPLDHLFHSHHFKLCTLKRMRDVGSDHFPLLSTLQYDPGSDQKSKESPDKEVDDWAKEKIEQEDVCEADVPNPAH